MKSVVIGAGSDLGVHIDGAKLGPTQLINDIKSFYKGEIIEFQQDPSIIKSRNISDRSKNRYEINELNEKMYNSIVDKMKQGYFPITLGGDHTVAIASSLADAKINEDVGIIWIDAHGDYNTFKTTITGNIHGLPLAAITGYECEDLRLFHRGEIIQPAKAVIVGARSLDKAEAENLKYSGVTVFTTEDIKKEGVESIMKKAFDIAGYKTRSIHISYDLDVIDPEFAPGVSVPEFDGINTDEAMEICDYIIEHFDKVTSYDIVELNPLRDVSRKTEQIALNILAKTINKINELEDKEIEEPLYWLIPLFY